jgi:FtsP/CotA-like multicopper oxidase with cupredoxin domain
MKYILGIAALALIVGGGFWYTQSDYMGMSMNMNGMVSGEIREKDNLSILKDENVPLVRPTEVVELQDGDTYEMVASIVKQEVGNRTVKRLAYNGQIPGPVLKAPKGANVTVNFTNNLDMETALHSHGLRGDWKMDGAVPITPAIKIGESFAYELEFPDTGVFWYHPHVREDYQQDMGLYGNFIVTEEGYWNEVNQEAYLIVDDMLEDGEYSREVVTNTLMGRFGDTLLINDQEDFNLDVKQGEITRAFITNVANTRTFKLEFEGAQMKLVGGDTGRIETEEIIDHQIIGTSERYVVELLYDTPGVYPIVHRGETMGTVKVEPAGTNRQSDFAVLRSNPADYTDVRTDFASLLAQAPDKNLRLDVELKGMMGDMMADMDSEMSDDGMVTLMGMQMDRAGAVEHCQMMPNMAGCEPYLKDEMPGMMGGEVEHGEDGIEWEDDMAMMNNMSTDETIEWIIEDTDSKAQNGDIDWSFEQGDMVKVRIFNDDKGLHPMQHPIHFHGQKFVILAVDGEANDTLQWKDSVLIPAGQTYDILVDMSNPGRWMAHCHIAEHLHSGMMFNFEVK